jgi:ATP/maltotriose-dependent transcriptional regulator MalT
MAQEFDLLGDPIPENWGKRGRPAHIPTHQNRNKIRVLLAFGWSNKEIAKALRITTETMRKHYSVELRQRDEARPALKAKAMMMIFDAAEGGNVAAMKELQRLIEKDEVDRMPARQARQPAPGKKELLNAAARDGHEDTGWGSVLN